MHARVVRVDASEALRVAGVRGVLLPEDIGRMSHPFGRFVSEPVPVVVAKSRYLAEDAVELTRVAYAPLPAPFPVRSLCSRW